MTSLICARKSDRHADRVMAKPCAWKTERNKAREKEKASVCCNISMDVKQETCDVDTNMMEITVNIKEENCEWESIYLKQENLSVKEEDGEQRPVNIKAKDEEYSVSIETHNHTDLKSVKEENFQDECQDGVMTGLDSYHRSSPEPSINVKSEPFQSDTTRTEETTSAGTQENQPPPTKKSGKTLTFTCRRLLECATPALTMNKSQKRKISEENREFNSAWTEAFAFTANDAGLPVCLICGDKISNNKKFNVERHFRNKHSAFTEKYPSEDERKRAISELQQKAEQSKHTFKKWITSPQSPTAASFVAAQEIVRRGKPFTDGEYMKESFIKISEHLFSDFKNKREIVQKIREMPLSAKTVKDSTIKMATNITSKQIDDINSAQAFSIACEESSDVNDIEQTALLCRYVNSDGPQEELIELIPLKGQTQGQDICEAVVSCLKAKGINPTHLVAVSTDGAPSMRGAQKGFVNLLQKSLDRELMTFHCILHQEALCAQTFPPECVEVMNLVIKIVKKIIASGLNHRQFCSLLEEVDRTYLDLLLHNRVRWLSRGEVLKRFATCVEHARTFLESNGLSYPELGDLDWLVKLHFMVDMTSHLNTLNKNLQGKGSTALQMLEDVLAFERKMTVFARDVQKGTLSHFPSLREFKEANNHINCDYFHRTIIAMQAAFRERFSELRKEKNTLSFPVAPLDIDPSLLNTSAFTGVSKPDLEIELADIADKDLWVSKFKCLTAGLEEVARQKATLAKEHKWSDIENLPKPDKLVFDTWSAIPETYMNMKKYAFGVLSIFGSTYLCEQVFSSMNFIKSKYHSQLTHESLQSCVKVKVTSYSPDIEMICSELQKQTSH